MIDSIVIIIININNYTLVDYTQTFKMFNFTFKVKREKERKKKNVWAIIKAVWVPPLLCIPELYMSTTWCSLLLVKFQVQELPPGENLPFWPVAIILQPLLSKQIVSLVPLDE